MGEVVIRLPDPGNVLVVVSDGVAWAAVPVAREFLLGAMESGPALLDIADEALERIQRKRDEQESDSND